MPSAGIVGINAETGKFTHHAPRQIAVCRNKRGCFTFIIDRVAQDESHSKRLFPLIRGFNQVNSLRRLPQRSRLHIGIACKLSPRIGRFRRTKRFTDHPFAQTLGGRHIVQMFHIRTQCLHCIEKLAQTELRMTEGRRIIGCRCQHLPGCIIQIAIQPGQHHRAIRQVRNGGNQFRRRRYGTGGTGNDNRPGWRMGAQPLHFAPDEIVAMRSGIRKPAFRQNIRPQIGDDVEKTERNLPPVGKVFRSNSSKLAPFSPISFDLIHQPCQIAGEPDRIGSRCRNGNVVNTEKGAHMRRQRFPPRTDQSR